MTRAIHAVRSWCVRFPDRAVVVALAIASYVPILLTSPGKVSADTKTYLTLDPGAVLDQAASMWDPSVGAGTVPHQNIGYLFPLGPYYWVADRIGSPDWLAQRMLWGTLVFAAAYGAYRLARWLGWGVAGAFVAAFAYGFSPYLLSYLARLSVILGPWAALPWMILLAARAARTRSWRPAALFAVVVALVGSVNATALILAGIGPVVWLLCDVVAGRVAARHAVAGALRIAVLSAAVSIWWIVALSVQGNFGIPILRYTETYEAVAGASTPAEIMRGLGYWFFYGGDQLDSWVGPSLPYYDRPILIALGFALAGASLLGMLVGFAGRATAAVLLLVGLAVSVGAAPLGDSTPYGSAFEWFASDTTFGMALRSTPRAAPLVILALAFGLGSSSEWFRGRIAARQRESETRPRWDLLAPVGVTLLLAVQLYPWFTADSLTPSLLRDEAPPAHVQNLATWLDDTDRDGGAGRVYEIPAADFANYRWGGTVDPILPGLIDRPYLARELVPLGAAGTADLLNAFERRIPEGWFEPETLRPIADRLGADTIVVRNDLEHERYRLARPGPLWTDVTSVLGEPDHAGGQTTDEPRIPLIDEQTLAHADAAPSFPVVAAFDIEVSPSVTAVPSTDPIILFGSGDGVVDMAGAGLLDDARPLLYGATLGELAQSGELQPEMIGDDPWWVVSDTNRRQGHHHSTVSSNLGALEGEQPFQLDPDPGNQQLDVFADAVERQTIGVHTADVADVRASYYGNLVAYTPEDAPWFAIDGDPATAWRAGVFEETTGLLWEVDLLEPVTTSSITLLQPVTGAVGRFITSVRITLDERTSFDVALDERSRQLPGQPISLPAGSFDRLRIEVLDDNVGELSTYFGQPGVGFAEITIPGVTDDRIVRLPRLTDSAIPDPVLADHRLTYLLTRQRIDPAIPNRTSPEPFLIREIEVPTPRMFTLSGELRLSADASDQTLLTVLDDPSGAVADRRLRGSPDSRGASAVDANPATIWQTPFDSSVGSNLTIDHASPISADHVTMSWLDDDLHSAPTEVVLRGDDGQPRTIPLSPGVTSDGVATASVAIDRYVSERSQITVTEIAPRLTIAELSGVAQELPIGIVEIRLGDTPNPTFDRSLPLSEACRDNLVEIDGIPVAVRLIGTRDGALTRSELALETCNGPINLAAGAHRIRALPGVDSGFDVDRLVLDGPSSPADQTAPRASEATDVTVDHHSATRLDADVAASASSSWLILEQSWNEGWTARVDTAEGTIDLGTPVLINGYANGWILPPSTAARTVQLEWAPQQVVRIALWTSLFVGLGVVALAIFGRGAPITDDARADRRHRAARRRRSTWLALLLVALLGLAAGPVVGVWSVIALIVAPRIRWFGAATVLLTGAIAAGSIVALEWRRDYSPGPDWPSRFGWTSPLVWIGVATVIVIAVMPLGVSLSWRPAGQTEVADTQAS
ncbi:MAG: alpha-(1-_3)-arabinofuranosyltransferase family protein [Acidimicrobiia bacterium]|nr:alpha-(1->3)-arabinofuranosyltransferase family protein [Acidimicrobiia bacterium]